MVAAQTPVWIARITGLLCAGALAVQPTTPDMRAAKLAFAAGLGRLAAAGFSKRLGRTPTALNFTMAPVQPS